MELSFFIKHLAVHERLIWFQHIYKTRIVREIKCTTKISMKMSGYHIFSKETVSSKVRRYLWIILRPIFSDGRNFWSDIIVKVTSAHFIHHYRILRNPINLIESCAGLSFLLRRVEEFDIKSTFLWAWI